MRTLTLALALLGVAACQDITTLQQSNPGAIEAAKVYVPSNAQLLVNGAISDFECAFTRYVVGTGVLSDELSNGISSSANFDYDGRRLPTNATFGTNTCGNNQQAPIYTTLSVARGSADTVIARLKEWTDAQMPAGVNRARLIAQAYAYAGYSILLLGEAMCSAAINVGPQLTSLQMFDTARTRFDSAIVYANAASPVDATTRDFATLGRARANLNLGLTAAASADASAIAPGFIVNTTNDALNVRRLNFSFVTINQNSWATVDPAYRAMTVGGNPDPRVAVTNTGRNGTAPGSQIWTPNKYPALNTVMPIARYDEAQLILAEILADANDLAGAETAINTARGAAMPQYSVVGLTQAQVQADVIEERRRELFLEGHRLYDFRRKALPLVPTVGTTFPGGGVYGDQVCFPLPDVERVNNPNIPNTP
jgi:hypothetical protein